MSSNPISTPRSMLDAKRSKIEQALQVLEEAAKDTKEDVVDVIRDKYSDTKSAFKDLLGELDFSKEAKDMLKDSQRTIRRTAKQVDSSIHENPWMYLGASALVGLTLGLIFGRKSS